MNPLISAAELAALIETRRAPFILDVRWYMTDLPRGKAEYLGGHIPGAVFASIDEVFSAPVADNGDGGRHPLPQPEVFEESLRALGLNEGEQVVVYDQSQSLSAGRAWWMLRQAGIDARVLDGGFKFWSGQRHPVVVDVPDRPTGDVTVKLGRGEAVNADDVTARQSEGSTVWDVRAAERFRGETEMIDKVAGHIPGAKNLPATQLFEADGRFKDAESLRELAGDIKPGDIVSCGSGVTAAQALVALEIAGIDGVALYSGSWSDWISNPDRPIAKGE